MRRLVRTVLITLGGLAACAFLAGLVTGIKERIRHEAGQRASPATPGTMA